MCVSLPALGNSQPSNGSRRWPSGKLAKPRVNFVRSTLISGFQLRLNYLPFAPLARNPSVFRSFSIAPLSPKAMADNVSPSHRSIAAASRSAQSSTSRFPATPSGEARDPHGAPTTARSTGTAPNARIFQTLRSRRPKETPIRRTSGPLSRHTSGSVSRHTRGSLSRQKSGPPSQRFRRLFFAVERKRSLRRGSPLRPARLVRANHGSRQALDLFLGCLEPGLLNGFIPATNGTIRFHEVDSELARQPGLNAHVYATTTDSDANLVVGLKLGQTLTQRTHRKLRRANAIKRSRTLRAKHAPVPSPLAKDLSQTPYEIMRSYLLNRKSTSPLLREELEGAHRAVTTLSDTLAAEEVEELLARLVWELVLRRVVAQKVNYRVAALKRLHETYAGGEELSKRHSGGLDGDSVIQRFSAYLTHSAVPPPSDFGDDSSGNHIETSLETASRELAGRTVMVADYLPSSVLGLASSLELPHEEQAIPNNDLAALVPSRRSTTLVTPHGNPNVDEDSSTSTSIPLHPYPPSSEYSLASLADVGDSGDSSVSGYSGNAAGATGIDGDAIVAGGIGGTVRAAVSRLGGDSEPSGNHPAVSVRSESPLVVLEAHGGVEPVTMGSGQTRPAPTRVRARHVVTNTVQQGQSHFDVRSHTGSFSSAGSFRTSLKGFSLLPKRAPGHENTPLMIKPSGRPGSVVSIPYDRNNSLTARSDLSSSSEGSVMRSPRPRRVSPERSNRHSRDNLGLFENAPLGTSSRGQRSSRLSLDERPIMMQRLPVPLRNRRLVVVNPDVDTPPKDLGSIVEHDDGLDVSSASSINLYH